MIENAPDFVGTYVKKPVQIQAYLWQNQEPGYWPSWLIDVEPTPADGGKLLLPTLEGDLTASFGDYIIRGVRGEVYACKADIFMETYDVVAREG